MRACIQRVSRAAVEVDGQTVGQIDRGLLVLLGVTHDDTELEARRLAEKIAGLRIFDDPQGKMNLSLTDIAGSMLVVSQFTLMADCRKGRRPSYTLAAQPAQAEHLYEQFVAAARDLHIQTATGQFRAHMQVSLINDGPVTLWIDTRELHLGSP